MLGKDEWGKISVFVHAQGMKTVQAGGWWVRKWQNLVHVVVECPLTALPFLFYKGLSSLGVPGVPWHTQILADQLTLFQPGQTPNYIITTGTPGFSDLPTALFIESLPNSLKKFEFLRQLSKALRELDHVLL